MNDEDVDRRLGALLHANASPPDPAFVDRVVAAAQLELKIREARQRSLRRAAVDCGAAVAVAATFFLLTQAQPPTADGIIPLQAPAMAGLIMLAMWAIVALPRSGGSWRAA